MTESVNSSRNLPLRINVWWQYIVPPVFAYAYLGLGQETQEPLVTAVWLGLFALSVLGTAGFGYFLNDWTDIRQDAVAGKSNQAAKLSIPIRVLIAAALIGLGWVPWYFLPANAWNLSLLGLQYLIFILYSLPPIRLKERGLAGIVCDMLYGHVIPATIALSTFLSPTHKDFPLFLTLACTVTALMGLRNILLHQIEDRRADKQAGVRTFVLNFGPLRSLNLINRVVLPLEVILIPVMLSALTGWRLILPLVYLGFWAFSYLTFNFWHWPWKYRSRGQRKMLFLHFLNDFYEEWLPVAAAALLCLVDPWFFLLLAAHLLLFPAFLINLIRDLRQIYRFFTQ